MPKDFPSIMPFWCSSSRRRKLAGGGEDWGKCVVLAASLNLWSLVGFFGCGFTSACCDG